MLFFHCAGVVFSVDTDGNNFKILHDFAGGTGDGAFPSGLLALSGSTLYGVTTAGGIIDSGVVFKVNTDGSGYTVLHQFAGTSDDGAFPQYGSLVVTNGLVYGAAAFGGLGDGVVFQMATNGDNFAVLHSFSGGSNDGAFPKYGPVVSGSALYGMTGNGGANALGVVYSLTSAPVTNNATPPPAFQVTAIARVTTNVVITWLTTGGTTNAVQVTPGDAKGGYTTNFFHLSSLIFIQGSGAVTTNYVDFGGAINFPSRFYRVRQVP